MGSFSMGKIIYTWIELMGKKSRELITVKPILDEIAKALHPWWKDGEPQKYKPAELAGKIMDLRDEISTLKKEKRRTDFELKRLRASRKDLLTANRNLRDRNEVLEKERNEAEDELTHAHWERQHVESNS